METIKFVAWVLFQFVLMFVCGFVAMFVVFAATDAALAATGVSILAVPHIVYVVGLSGLSMMLTAALFLQANMLIERVVHGRKMRRA